MDEDRDDAGGNDSNAYTPWAQHGISRARYFENRYLEERVRSAKLLQVVIAYAELEKMAKVIRVEINGNAQSAIQALAEYEASK